MAEENEHAAEAPAAGAGSSTLVTAMKIGAFVVVVLSVECLVAFLLLPSSTDVNAMAEARYANGIPPVDFLDEPDAANSDEPRVEVDLGDYSVTAFQPLSNTTLRIDFHLYGTVLEKKQSEFDQFYGKNVQRLREKVIVIVRGSEITDLTDPSLALIKRKILDKANRTLGKSLLTSIIISEFAFVEQ